jgi:hypothetical protein
LYPAYRRLKAAKPRANFIELVVVNAFVQQTVFVQIWGLEGNEK